MGSLYFRSLEYEECEKIKEINASQYIGRAWRNIDGQGQLVVIDYQDPDWPNGYETHLNNLKKTFKEGGSAIGAFDKNGKLVGFSALNRSLFGEKSNYVLLDQLFVSLDSRNCGIGKSLFLQTALIAKEWKADKIYICAGSAEETIAFYRKIGCIETEELQQELYELDPRDIHLEFDLHIIDSER
jgi:N-acetylglutamate synthase-like GNAT family acetyltransferase